MNRRTIRILLILAAILWNGWLLAVFIYPYSTWSHMEISELSIPSQPWSLLFRSLDGLSAFCMIIAAVGLLTLFFKKIARVWFVVLACLLLSVGLLTFFDITHSLDCVQYQNSLCIMEKENNVTSRDDYLHEAESRITSYVSIAFAIVIGIMAILYSDSPAMKVLGFGLLVSVIWSLAILNETKDLFTYAINDRLWNLFVAGDLVLVARLIPATDMKRINNQRLGAEKQ